MIAQSILLFLCAINIVNGRIEKDSAALSAINLGNGELTWVSDEIVKGNVPKTTSIYAECVIANTLTSVFTKDKEENLKSKISGQINCINTPTETFYSYICTNTNMLKSSFYLRTLNVFCSQENEAMPGKFFGVNYNVGLTYFYDNNNHRRVFNDKEFKYINFLDVYHGMVEKSGTGAEDYSGLINIQDINRLEDKEKNGTAKERFFVANEDNFQVDCSLVSPSEKILVPPKRNDVHTGYLQEQSRESPGIELKPVSIGTLLIEVHCEPKSPKTQKRLIFVKRTSLLRLNESDPNLLPLTYTQSFVEDISPVTKQEKRRVYIEDFSKIVFNYKPELRSKEMDIMRMTDHNKPDTKRVKLLGEWGSEKKDITCNKVDFFVDYEREAIFRTEDAYREQFFKDHVKKLRPNFVDYTYTRYHCDKSINGSELYEDLIILKIEGKLKDGYKIPFISVHKRGKYQFYLERIRGLDLERIKFQFLDTDRSARSASFSDFKDMDDFIHPVNRVKPEDIEPDELTYERGEINTTEYEEADYSTPPNPEGTGQKPQTTPVAPVPSTPPKPVPTSTASATPAQPTDNNQRKNVVLDLFSGALGFLKKRALKLVGK